MKCLSFLIFLTVFSFSSFSQKQDEGDIPIELEFSPLGANPLKISSIRSRYFLKDNLAFRTGIFLGGTSNPSYSEINNIELVNSSRSFNFNIRPGIEKHFNGTDRLSPYYGGELSFTNKKDVTSNQSVWLSNADEIKTQKNISSNSIYGLNIFSGADFYITDKIFLGVEIGFGLQYDGRGRTSVKWRNPENNSESNSKEIGNTSSFQWGPNYQGTIRLGYCLNNLRK
jgi:hypothetical protein